VPYGQLQQLAHVLSRAGAEVGKEVSELLLASRCDLLLTAMLNGFEDYAEVPPLDEDGAEAECARSLLQWALTGQVPDRYRRYATPRRLLDEKYVDLFVAVAQELKAGSHGADLGSFGGVRVTLAAPIAAHE
jgi:hypothetical protein